MVVMEKCCCCSVRTACLIFGGLALFGSLMQVSSRGKEVARHLTWNEQQKEAEVDVLYDSMRDIGVTKEQLRTFQKVDFYMSIPDLILSFALVCASSCLIHGVRNKKPSLFIPVMVVFGLDFFVRLIFVMVLIITFGLTSPLSITICIVFFYGVIIDVFIGLCVYSHWQQLKEEGASQSSYNAVSKI